MNLLTLKHTNMKKILFAAVAALAITSCSQNEAIDAPAQKTPVSFKTIVNKSARATAMLEADFSEFKVYAYNTKALKSYFECLRVSTKSTPKSKSGFRLAKTEE